MVKVQAGQIDALQQIRPGGRCRRSFADDRAFEERQRSAILYFVLGSWSLGGLNMSLKPCITCGETGLAQPERECELCSGTGRFDGRTCPMYNCSAGKVICPGCDGRGSIIVDDGDVWWRPTGQNGGF